MRFNDDSTTSTDDSVTVKSTPVSRQTRARSWLTVWPIFFMVWVAVWASIGQVRSSTFGSVTPSYTSQLTMQSTHINTNEDMQRKPLRAIYNRKENLIGRRFYLGRVNKRRGAESTHHPMTFLLDKLIILLQSPTITNFDSYTRPYRKKNDSTHNHVMGLPNHGYEWFSSTRSKSSRGGIGVFSRAYQHLVIHRGSAEGISSRNTIKILPDDLQYLFSWGTKPSFKRRSLRPGQTVPPTPSSGSAAPSSPVARSSQAEEGSGVVQGL